MKNWSGLPGRPTADRQALARAFAAKPVFKIDQTKLLRERLQSDKQLRVLCGWNSISQIPSEATFSRAFSEFALSKLPSRVHEALIKSTHKDRLVGHISRDSTEITAREKPLQKQSIAKPKYKRGRPQKGEVREAKDKRLDKQGDMSLDEMLADLPVACDVGSKLNAKGYKHSWIGYKLHLDLADGCIPISCLITSASLHDSQAAIPLAVMTNERCTNCYDLMDSAYDAPQIKAYSRQLGHVPIIETNARANRLLKHELDREARCLKLLGHSMPEQLRYNERTTAERANARLKDEFGARCIWVRGADKIMCHLMFGILALCVDQLMRFVA